MTSIVAKGGEKSSSFPSVSVGIHKARCIKVIDLGTQKNDYQGNVSWKRQVLVIWETPDQTDDNSVPLTISKFYTLSLHEKSNLGIDLTSWRGRAFSETEKKGFDIAKLAGKECTLNVIQGNKNKSKIYETEKWMFTNKIPILALQETHISKNHKWKTKHFTWFHSGGENKFYDYNADTHYYTGVAFVINDNWLNYIIDIVKKKKYKALWIL